MPFNRLYFNFIYYKTLALFCQILKKNANIFQQSCKVKFKKKMNFWSKLLLNGTIVTKQKKKIKNYTEVLKKIIPNKKKLY